MIRVFLVKRSDGDWDSLTKYEEKKGIFKNNTEKVKFYDEERGIEDELDKDRFIDEFDHVGRNIWE